MVIRENQADSHSAVERRKSGVFLIEFNRERPGVVTHRRRLFPAVAFFFVSLIGLRQPPNGQSKRDWPEASSIRGHPDRSHGEERPG